MSSVQLPTVTLTIPEIAAIAARAEVELFRGERGVWTELWERLKAQIKA